MKILSLLLAAFVLAAPMYAQSAAATGAAAADETAAKTGVRFVIVAPNGGSLPNPLFCKQGKAYKEIKISSRTPSLRVKPEGGVVNFYPSDPTAAMAAAQGAAGKTPAKVDKDAMPKPVLSVTVPGSASKMLCILVPSKDGGTPQTFFLNEKDFPKGGLHIINFSPNKLVMSISEDPTNPAAKKDSVIGVFKRDAGVSAENSWSFKSDENGKEVSFKLSYLPKDGKNEKDLKLLRASKFVVSSRQSQINIVVKTSEKDAPRETFKLMPIQLSGDRGAAAEE